VLVPIHSISNSFSLFLFVGLGFFFFVSLWGVHDDHTRRIVGRAGGRSSGGGV